ncbi:Uncharacterised protein [Mycobacteroides abscessus subsp. abscessus]|uniref:hypothetical protein n=1 Tax=Mycobacteroides abscessus TaxID=36809 RepID=UPI0009277721|nr:hypothetical protein [Mycobacteroides abscessus]SIC55959.1 Uncharacterised protein [Mycobacteroides abscessus subsp. abscessus]SKU57949.1 Uncharacterised protein [Mycobacteroides abscessus subsp. abscessus]
MAWSELDQQIANAWISLRRAIRQLDYSRAQRVMSHIDALLDLHPFEPHREGDQNP